MLFSTQLENSAFNRNMFQLRREKKTKQNINTYPTVVMKIVKQSLESKIVLCGFNFATYVFAF